MSSHRRFLIVPCETQNRELDAKLLLSCFAAERGFTVVVGSKKAINLRLGSLPRSIYLSKSLTDRNLRIYEILVQLGHRVVCGDEEGLIHHSPESYLNAKVGKAAPRRAERLLAWGPENARIWRGQAGLGDRPIHETGNPRIDLLRPELRAFFDEDSEKLRARYGRFVLINTNFSRLNHFYPAESRLRAALERARSQSESERDSDARFALHKQTLFEHFVAMIEPLASAHPDVAFVIRPHPSENHAVWQQAAGGRPNVHVVHEGNVLPWLRAAELLIHNGCTTSVEAYLLGEASIAYRPVADDELDVELANGLSDAASDLPSLQERVAERLAGRAVLDPGVVAERRALIARHVAALDGPLAAERIVDVLEAMHAEPAALPGLATRARGHARLAVRALRKRQESGRAGHRNNREFLLHMFPGIDLPETRARIERFGKLLGRFEGIRVQQLWPNVFEVAARESGGGA